MTSLRDLCDHYIIFVSLQIFAHSKLYKFLILTQTVDKVDDLENGVDSLASLFLHPRRGEGETEHFLEELHWQEQPSPSPRCVNQHQHQFGG